MGLSVLTMTASGSEQEERPQLALNRASSDQSIERRRPRMRVDEIGANDENIVDLEQ